MTTLEGSPKTSLPPNPADTATTPPPTNTKLPPRPPQKFIDNLYLDSIKNLAQCDEEYCEDADAKYHTSLLYYTLKQGPDEWEPVITHQQNDDEPSLEKHLQIAFERYDANKNVQQSLNAYRVNRWRNPLINYDVRKFRSPLYYRGAPDLWRRLHQTRGRPTLLQCLDFTPFYHKLKKQYAQNPDHLRLERQYTLALFDQKVCIPGLQCPGLRPFMMWCMQNPAATPQQVEDCIVSLPRYAECAKPGYIPPNYSMEQNPIYLGESTVGITRAQLEAGRRLKDWVVKAEIITSATRGPDRNRRDPIQDEKLDDILENYPRFDAESNIVPARRPVVKTYHGSETEDDFDDVYQYEDQPSSSSSQSYYADRNQNGSNEAGDDNDGDNNNDDNRQNLEQRRRAVINARYQDPDEEDQFLPLARRRIPGMANDQDIYDNEPLTSKDYLKSIISDGQGGDAAV